MSAPIFPLRLPSSYFETLCSQVEQRAQESLQSGWLDFATWILAQKQDASRLLYWMEEHYPQAYLEATPALAFLIVSCEFLGDYHIQIFSQCLNSPGILNAVNEQGSALLICALQLKHHPLIELLLEHGARPSVKDAHGVSALEYFFERYEPQDVPLIARLLTRETLTTPQRFEQPWLHVALAQEHCTPLVEHLLQLGEDPNFCDPEGYTPLMSAARFGEPQCVRSLLSYGAQPQTQLHDYLSALSIALGGRVGPARYGKTPLRKQHIECAVLLLHSLKEQHLDESLVPPLVRLWLSLLHFEPSFFNALLQAGAQLNHRDAQGDTLLHWASLSHTPHSVVLCSWALDQGANPSLLNEKGQLPYQIARIRHNEPCALLLQSAHEKGTLHQLLPPLDNTPSCLRL